MAFAKPKRWLGCNVKGADGDRTQSDLGLGQFDRQELVWGADIERVCTTSSGNSGSGL